jgi:hypothetical protein
LEFKGSKFLTSKSDEGSGGRRYMPYAFTEQGIYMLITVLRGETCCQAKQGFNTNV